jgi:hypothetical protein
MIGIRVVVDKSSNFFNGISVINRGKVSLRTHQHGHPYNLNIYSCYAGLESYKREYYARGCFCGSSKASRFSEIGCCPLEQQKVVETGNTEAGRDGFEGFEGTHHVAAFCLYVSEWPSKVV